MHLLEQEVLGLLDLVGPLFFLELALRVSNLGLKHPSFHVGSVGLVVGLLHLPLRVDLCVQHVLYRLGLLPRLQSLVDLTFAGGFILLNALLDVLTFLSLLKFFIFVVDYVRHLVHDRCDAPASFFDCKFALPLAL